MLYQMHIFPLCMLAIQSAAYNVLVNVRTILFNKDIQIYTT